MHKDIWAVVPAYNESSSVDRVVGELFSMVGNVVVVDDGSLDDTETIGLGAGAILLRHTVNLGQGAALQTGISFALSQGAKYILTFDADDQHCVADIPIMFRRLLTEEFDVILGSRFLGNVIGMPIHRRIVLRLAILFTRITTGLSVTDTHNGIRLFSRYAAEQIEITHNRMAHASEILNIISKKKIRYAEVPVQVSYSNYSMRKGQSSISAIQILLDLLMNVVRKWL